MASPILSIDGIATRVSDTSNNISNRITDLYTKDITFQENVNVSGDLKVEGTTVTIKTDTYTTETLEIVNTASINNSTLLKINQTKDSGNIIEVLKDTGTVITVDNSGNLTTTGTINSASAAEIGKLAGIGPTTIISQLNDKQGLLSDTTDVTVKDLTVTGSTTIKNTTIDVGRGDVYIENNTDDDDGVGAGITIRTSDNPTTGSIFSVRSSGDANRLWVGQSITTTGNNDFGVGNTSGNGGESILSGYKFQVDAVTGNVTTTGNVAAGNTNISKDFVLGTTANITPHLTIGNSTYTSGTAIMGYKGRGASSIINAATYWKGGIGNYGKDGFFGIAVNNYSGSFGITGNELTSQTHFAIKHDGNVGIGTTTPTEKLHVSGNANVSGDLQVMGDVKTTGTIDIRQDPSGDDFFPEQRYPPRVMTGLTDTVSGQSYGNGLYEVSASSPPYNNNDALTYQAFYAQYHATNGYNAGVYTKQDFIVPGYLGDWIKLKLPVAIKLTKYGFTSRSDTPSRAPGQYKIYGSNDNINWTVLVHKTSTITYGASDVFEESITTNGVYKYFALVVNKLSGIDAFAYLLNFFNFAIYGQEVNKKFSVDASDGSGYFAGDLQVNGNITTTGTINGGGGGGDTTVTNLIVTGEEGITSTWIPSSIIGTTLVNFPRENISGYSHTYTTGGVVRVRVSTAYSSTYDGWKACDGVGSTTWISESKYSSTGIYNGDPNYFRDHSSYRGEYIILDLGEHIQLRKYEIRSETRPMKDFRVYATNDDGAYDNIFSMHWNLIDDIVDATFDDLVTIGFTSHSVAYRYYAIIAKKVEYLYMYMYDINLIGYTVTGYTAVGQPVLPVGCHLFVEGELTVTGTVLSSFTGNHICKSESLDIYDDRYIGYLVSSSKKYKSINSKYDPSNIKQNIDKQNNDCLPVVNLASIPNDKNVFGVISKIEDKNATTRQQTTGGTTSIFKKESYDRRLVISGCGEGFLWVSDYNGQLEAGDLISSSLIPGIGMKQDDDLLRSCTVAKITMDCDFNPGLIPVKVLQSSNCDVEYTTTSNILHTSNYEAECTITSNISSFASNYDIECVITSNLSIEYTTVVETVQTSNDTIYPRDENGEYIYENQLDIDGNIIYDYEYEMKYIKLDGTITNEDEYTNGSNVYRMALVGGCYKCS
jgi:hypothetical protein